MTIAVAERVPGHGGTVYELCLRVDGPVPRDAGGGGGSQRQRRVLGPGPSGQAQNGHPLCREKGDIRANALNVVVVVVAVGVVVVVVAAAAAEAAVSIL